MSRPLVGFLAAILIALPVIASCPDFIIKSTPRYIVGEGPGPMVKADFNGDGRTDLAVVTRADHGNTLSILLGNGNGTFRSAANYAVGDATADMAAGDFDGDGITDVAITQGIPWGGPGCPGNPACPDPANSNNVLIFRGNGDGTFAPPLKLTPGDGPAAIAAADLNGDGKADLVISNASDNLWILLANDSGSFAPPQQYLVGNSSGYSRAGRIRTADFNGDGKVDLAILRSVSNSVSICLGNGDGTFLPPVNFATDLGAMSLAVGDVNGDGKIDLAVGFVNLTGISIRLGSGTGTFSAPMTYTASSIRNVTRMAIGDFDNDGKGDLAIIADAGLLIALGNGDGTFRSPAAYGGNMPQFVIVDDFDGDGKADIAYSEDLHDVAVLLGNGNGTFQNYGGSSDSQAIAVGDLNGDGISDLVLANGKAGNVSVLLGDGTGGFRAPTTYSTAQTIGFGPSAVLLNDFNGDGKQDVAVLESFASFYDGFDVLLGNGDGTLSSPLHNALQANAFISDDFNNDGKKDLALQSRILLGNGDGTFTSKSNIPVASFALASGDFNGDGKRDLALTNSSGSNIWVLLGNGDGTFASPVSYAVGSSPGAIVAADFNGDGKTDLATTQANSVSVILGNGDGTFGAPANVVVGQGPRSIVAGDFNQDGKIDLAVGNYNSNSVSILIGKGDGTFTVAETFPFDGPVWSIVTADFNADGKVDVATVTPVVSILLNTCDLVASVDSISPSSGPSTGGQGVVIRGANLGGTSSVKFDVAAASITSKLSTSVTALTPSHAAGPVDIAIAGTGGSATLVGRYTYIAAPQVNIVTPAAGKTSGGDLVAISGMNLTDATAVKFGSVAAQITARRADSLTVKTPPHTSGTVDVAVTTDGGTSRLVGAYTFVAAPLVSGVSPNAGRAAGGEHVSISGANLSGATSVTFGGVAATIVDNSGSSMTVVVPPHPPGTVDIVVVTVGGSSSYAGAYTYAAATAAIPTLSEWLLVALAAVLAMTGAIKLR